MLPKYNTYIFQFDDITFLDEFILVDDEFKMKFGNWYYFDNLKSIKIWKSGKITDVKNKSLKIESRIHNFIDKNGVLQTINQLDWKFGKSKHDYYPVKDVIWNVYTSKYKPNKTFLNCEVSKYGIQIKDGNNLDFNLSDIYEAQFTNDNTKIFNDKINFFEFDFKIGNDQSSILKLPEPQIIKELPDLEIYSNGVVVDTRGLSQISINKKGYKVISYLGKNYQIHRLVAKAFLRNDNNYEIVNHLDRNKINNDVRNLEWVNNTINTLHSKLALKYKDENVNLTSNGVNGWIALTSKNYRNFVKSKISLELKIPINYWIFSCKTPLFLLYLPFSREYGLRGRHSLIFDFQKEVESIFNKFFNKDNKKYNELFQGDRKYSEETYWFVIENINRYLVPTDQNDHLLNVLESLGIDFDEYFNWLFDDLKKLINDDVGFIFYEEFRTYLSLIRKNEGFVFQNDLLNSIFNRYLIKNKSRVNISRNIENYINEFGNIIAYQVEFHRVIEKFPSLISEDENKMKISENFNMIFRYWDTWNDRINLNSKD